VPRILVLDSGPLSDACRRRGSPDVEQLRDWLILTRMSGAIVAIPEIADYEVRRGLILAGSTEGIRRLDELREDLRFYIPISTASMRRAAGLRADARRREIATDDDKGIDADFILAAQAMLFCGLNDELTVATYNAGHLSRYVDAHDWGDIEP
jgi:predicted nucleic acid-binding protein